MKGSSGPPRRARRTLPFVLLLVFVATLPFGVSWSFGPLDLVHFMVAATVLTTAVLRVAGGMLPWRWHPSATWLMLLVSLQLVSLVTARDPEMAVRSVVTFVLGVLLALTVHSLCANSDRWRDVVTVMVVMGALAGVYGMVTAGALEVQFAGAGALDGRAVGVFNQPNQLGTFSAALLLIAWGLALAARSHTVAWISALCALLAAANLVLSFSRGAWIGAVLGAVLLVVLIPASGRRHLRGAAGLLAVAVPLTWILAPQVPSLVYERIVSIADPQSNPDDQRPLIYQEAYRQILQRPVLGQGPGNFQTASRMAEARGAGVDALHTHSMVLQAAAETGLLSLAVLGALVLSLGWRVWRALPELPGTDATVMIGLACAAVAVLGQGLFDYTLTNPILSYLMWTVVGSLLAASDRGEPWLSVRHGRVSL